MFAGVGLTVGGGWEKEGRETPRLCERRELESNSRPGENAPLVTLHV